LFKSILENIGLIVLIDLAMVIALYAEKQTLSGSRALG